ncbi:MAG: hypothetical protein ACPGWR_26330 [Ardenticatenaceae bacterium]
MELQYRQQVAVLGMLIGSIVGGIVALLWLDNFSEPELTENKVAKLGYGDMARIATATVAIVRQLNDLAKDANE